MLLKNKNKTANHYKTTVLMWSGRELNKFTNLVKDAGTLIGHTLRNPANRTTRKFFYWNPQEKININIGHT